MDIEKLIEQLHIAGAGNPGNIFDEAADALSTLQAENDKLRDELERMKRLCEITELWSFHQNIRVGGQNGIFRSHAARRRTDNGADDL